MKKHALTSFTCPRCEIEQHDLVAEETYLLSDPGDRTTIFRCNSCGEILLNTEARTAEDQALLDLLFREETAIRRRRRFEIIGGVIFWIIVALLLRCWLS